MNESILAIDVGTSATKAAIIARDGQVLASQSSGYETRTGPNGELEQNPEDWWQATLEAIRLLEPTRFEISAIILTGQMQDLIVLKNASVLRPAILYSDARASAEAEQLDETWTALTGNLQGASSLPAKLLWLKSHESEIYSIAYSLLFGAHDFVTWKLTGARVADRTTASTTGLLDLETGMWATAMLEALGLRTDWLPELRNAGEIVGRLSSELSTQLGLPINLPVLHGIGDAGAATIGAGAGEPGTPYIYLGTSGWLASSVHGSRGNPHRGVFTLAHPNPRSNILIGPMLTAGGNMEWIRTQLGLEHDAFERLASSAEPGCHGTIFLPYLTGERSPFMNPEARAEFKRISNATTQADLARAVLEGVALGFRSIAQSMKLEMHDQLYIAGGGARSNLWCQIIADVLNTNVARLENAEDVGVRGAALLAARSLGWLEGLHAPNFFPVERVFTPDPKNVPEYEHIYKSFLEVNPHLTR
jgi:xylulokinase